MQARDRRAALIASTAYNGIDFVEVVDPLVQTALRVHFLNGVMVRGTLLAAPTITGGESLPAVAVLPVANADWGQDGGHVVLTLRVPAPGDFSLYTLTLASPALDPYFARVRFSFKAGCPSDLDCRAPAPPCPTPLAPAPPIDYLAKDFLSFRQALLDFSALRYPDWQERSEADFGVMMLEALSALADDLSYTQDRVAAEATLATATERRSVLRHARLVDYEPLPAISASALLQFDVALGVHALPYGLLVWALAPDGAPVPFETGSDLLTRLVDAASGTLRAAPPAVAVSALWNRGVMAPYWFDDSERCLPAGATSLIVLGRGYALQPGTRLLIETTGDPGEEARRQIVQLTAIDELCDPIFPRAPVTGGPPWFTCPTTPPAPLEPTALTRLTWRAEDALVAARDLTRTVLAGNIVPATQGQTRAGDRFAASPTLPPAPGAPPAAIERTGPRPLPVAGVAGAPLPVLSWTLASGPLAWLPAAAGSASGLPVPEVLLIEQPTAARPTLWSWFRTLLDAGAFDAGFTLDPARFAAIARNSDLSAQYDYDGAGGDTLRFGDGVFGRSPEAGALFALRYRVGLGAAGNVAAGAIRHAAPEAAATVLAVTNPLPAAGGADAEPLEAVRRRAPQAFRAEQFRAVLAEDYRATAETLAWVQRAGSVFRWTGSWLTVFTTPDPLGSEQISDGERTELVALLNRRRMAGVESYVPDPRYVGVDLQLLLCAVPDAYAGAVEAAVIAALMPPGGFFSPDNFTFGQALELSALAAAIQRVAGVGGVLSMRVRVRGRSSAYVEMVRQDAVRVGVDEIIRCDNDPSRPERGALGVTVMGGR